MGKSYDITGPESPTYTEAADILSIELGKKIRYIYFYTSQFAAFHFWSSNFHYPPSWFDSIFHAQGPAANASITQKL